MSLRIYFVRVEITKETFNLYKIVGYKPSLHDSS